MYMWHSLKVPDEPGFGSLWWSRPRLCINDLLWTTAALTFNNLLWTAGALACAQECSDLLPSQK
jgi:hypothetical protein